MVQHADIDHTGLTGAGGSVATDAIWDAAGDLAVGSGANTAAKLTKGSDGTVLTVTAGAVGWSAPAAGGVGKVAHAGPIGWSPQITSTGNYDLAAVSGANAGAFAVPVYVTGPMSAEGIAVVNGDAASARSCEFRLYLDGGDSTADFVTGTDGTMSFTPSAVSVRRGSFSAAPVTLSVGTYWLVIRNTNANTFGVRRGSGAVAGMYAAQTHAGIATLGASLELVTSWSDQISPPHAWIEGRVLGLTVPL
jgi:hypothetical protein